MSDMGQGEVIKERFKAIFLIKHVLIVCMYKINQNSTILLDQVRVPVTSLYN
jgi:hypothetical protein